MKRLAVCCIAVLLFLLPQHAAGQGRGRPKRPQPTVSGTPPSTTPSAGTLPVTTSSTSALRQFGSWVDDASVPVAGGVSAGVALGYWRTHDGSQVDAPMFDLGYGITDQIKLTATVPFYHVNYAGWTGRGMDDVYLGTKIAVIDPDVADRHAGLAVTPVLEILSTPDDNGRRLHWALPVSVEARSGVVRVYGSAGYFSRGAVFAGGAFEWAATTRTTITTSLTESTSLKRAETVAPSDVGRHRVDVAVGVANAMTDTFAGFFSIGRSLTSIEAGGTTVGLVAGVSWSFSPRTRPRS